MDKGAKDRQSERHSVPQSVPDLLALGQTARARACRAFALGRIPILGREIDPPEEGRRLFKFQANFRSAGLLRAKKSHRASQFFHRLRIDDSKLLPAHDFLRQPHHAAVSVY